MDYLVHLGNGDHDTDDVAVKNAMDEMDAILMAVDYKLATSSEPWHVIDVSAIFDAHRTVQ